MKSFCSILFLNLLLIPLLPAQTYYPDNSLRLQPVWSRVADAFGEAGSVESVEFSPNAKKIVSGTKFDNSIVMWRTSDGTELWRKYAKAEIERVGWSADGKYVASCSEDFLVQIWEAETGKLVQELPHTQGIDGLAWSTKGNWLVTGEEEIKTKENGKKIVKGWIRVFEIPSGKVLHKIDVGGTTNEVMFTEDNRLMVAAGHGFVKIFDTSNMQEIRHFSGPEGYKFVTADFTPDGKHIAAGGFEGLVFIWNIQSGELVRKMNYRGRKVESLCWHPNGNYLVTSGHGPYLNIFRSEAIFNKNAKEVPAAAQVFANDGAEYIDFNADGSLLVSAHQDGIIRLWVFMGEDAELNSKRHSWVKKQQKVLIEKN